MTREEMLGLVDSVLEVIPARDATVVLEEERNAAVRFGQNRITQNMDTFRRSLILTVGDEYYDADESSDTFPDGAAVSGLVDSINYATSYGNVWESNEANNLWPDSGLAGVMRRASNSSGLATPGLPER